MADFLKTETQQSIFDYLLYLFLKVIVEESIQCTSTARTAISSSFYVSYKHSSSLLLVTEVCVPLCDMPIK